MGTAARNGGVSRFETPEMRGGRCMEITYDLTYFDALRDMSSRISLEFINK